MFGVKGGPSGQKSQCQDPCQNPCNPCPKVPVCVDPCQDPCKPGLQSQGGNQHHNYGPQGPRPYFLQTKDPCKPSFPNPCQGQGKFY